MKGTGGPQVTVLGGPNGAGKTTCAQELLPRGLGIRQFVNADTIAVGLAGFAPETTALQAGRLMLDRLQELGRSRQDFAFETTLASRSFAPFLQRLSAEGYGVHLIYVWLRSPDLAVQRVAQRVLTGGHTVPEDVVRRRYWRGLGNFARLYRPLADTWLLCDNSGRKVLRVAWADREAPANVLEPEIYHEFEAASGAA